MVRTNGTLVILETSGRKQNETNYNNNNKEKVNGSYIFTFRLSKEIMTTLCLRNFMRSAALFTCWVSSSPVVLVPGTA